MNVYQVFADINRFCGFRDRRADLFDSIYKDIRAGRSLKDIWNAGPCDVIPGKKGDFVDGPTIFAHFSATKKAVDCLAQLAGTAIEFLPFEVNGEQYLALYLPRTTDCLDVDKSEFWGSNRNLSQIRTAVFIRERIPADLLFRLKDRAFEYYCTDKFKDLVEQSRLTGLTFRLVWSDPASATKQPMGSVARVVPDDGEQVRKRRRQTKRERLLERLWTDVIDHWQSPEALAEVLSQRHDDSEPEGGVLSEAAEVLRLAEQKGIDRPTLQRLLRSIAYRIVFDTLMAIEEEGADTSAALRCLHEDLLMAGMKR